jgi:hypothetical protein
MIRGKKIKSHTFYLTAHGKYVYVEKNRVCSIGSHDCRELYVQVDEDQDLMNIDDELAKAQEVSIERVLMMLNNSKEDEQ